MRGNRDVFQTSFAFVLGIFFLASHAIAQESRSDGSNVLPGTLPLNMEGDIAANMVDGIDRFLLKETEMSTKRRESYWKRDYRSALDYTNSLSENRKELSSILGVRDQRVPFSSPDLVASLEQDALVAKHELYNVYAIRWPVIRDVTSEGLLLIPHDKNFRGNLIYIPDADQSVESVCQAEEPDWLASPARWAEKGYRVVVPAIVSRRLIQPQGRSQFSQREFLYRSGFVLGRHLLGYEIQKVLGCVDWMHGEDESKPLLVRGFGEGGLIALFAGALDTRIDEVEVLGAFGSRNQGWQECIDRNIFGLLKQFGDAELAAMIAPRRLSIDMSGGPSIKLSGERGGAPSLLDDSLFDWSEIDRARELTGPLSLPASWLETTHAKNAPRLAPLVPAQWFHHQDPVKQQERLVRDIERDTQWLLRESSYVRAEFMKKLNTTSLDAFQASAEPYRAHFRDHVIGAFDYPLQDFHARSRKIRETKSFVAYEVVLDVWDDVFAYGILLIPRGMPPDEKRPVVVCQHGLEGRPIDTIEKDHPAYHDFAAKLCERGFLVFAPQNIYIGRDRFRTLQRKANPLGKTLFSIMVPQHQQIVNWLKTLPNVDPKRIAFYGLSYGGKSAMRIPPLVPDYCLSICSADFNEWVAKNASTRLPFSYIWTNEYEIFEWDLGSTFNYAEMAALIAPRPFMVERGHLDGVSTDEWVSFEYAKVFHLYSHRLKRPDLCEIEIFDGPHTIHGKGTFDFLHKHLQWPKPNKLEASD